jgi:hypothetical protein
MYPLATVTAFARRNHVLHRMRASLTQWRQVILRHLALAPLLAVITPMILGFLDLNPLRMG